MHINTTIDVWKDSETKRAIAYEIQVEVLHHNSSNNCKKAPTRTILCEKTYQEFRKFRSSLGLSEEGNHDALANMLSYCDQHDWIKMQDLSFLDKIMWIYLYELLLIDVANIRIALIYWIWMNSIAMQDWYLSVNLIWFDAFASIA